MTRILVPDYFEQFHCKCGECRHPCCDGWGIRVSEKEYFTLLGLSCSKRLRNKLDDAFVLCENGDAEGYARITPNFRGDCPMLDEDGLCLLQKEQGENALPLVCRLYPRSIKRCGERYEVCMSCSCEKTVELLMASEMPLLPHEIEWKLPFEGISMYENDPEKDALRHDSIDIVSNPMLSIGERLALLAKRVCGGEALPAKTKEESLCSVLGFLRALCGRSESIRVYGEAALNLLGFGEVPISESLSRFEEAQEHLYVLFPRLEGLAGRVMSNHLLYEGFPFSRDCANPDAAFAAFCAAVALLKVLCVCGMAQSDKKEDLIDILCYTNRYIEHSDYYLVCSKMRHPTGQEALALFLPILRR